MKAILISLVLAGLLSGCGCSENHVETEEVPECVDSMDGLEWPESDDACRACCQNAGYDEGMTFGTVQNATNASCECGDHMVCDDQ